MLDYEDQAIRSCIVDSLIQLGLSKEAEIVQESTLTIDLINRLIDTIKKESERRNQSIDERLYFLGLTY